jgi:hypothetical protein
MCKGWLPLLMSLHQVGDFSVVGGWMVSKPGLRDYLATDFQQNSHIVFIFSPES